MTSLSLATFGCGAIVALCAAAASAQSGNRPIEQVTIVGTAETQKQVTGAAQIVAADDIARYQYTDIQTRPRNPSKVISV